MFVIASEAKQSSLSSQAARDCFVASLLAMTERSRDADASEFCFHAIPCKALPRREAERRRARSYGNRISNAAAPSECSERSASRYGPHGGGSPLGAPPRRLPRKSMPGLSPGRVSCDLRRDGRYPAPLSQSSGTLRRPVIMPAEAMPRPPGSKVTSPARGNRTRPVSRTVSRNVPSWAGRL